MRMSVYVQCTCMPNGDIFHQLVINFYFPEIGPSTTGQSLEQILTFSVLLQCLSTQKNCVQNSLVKVAFVCCCTFQHNYYYYYYYIHLTASFPGQPG